MEKLLTCVVISSLALLAVSGVVAAQEPVLPCYYYGVASDGYLGKPTAFASWWFPPDIPLTVRTDYMGVALAGYPPGTIVRIEVVALPSWAWPSLKEQVIGKTVLAVVTDRPGANYYVDAWVMTFDRLSGGRLWIGLLYVTVQEIVAP